MPTLPSIVAVTTERDEPRLLTVVRVLLSQGLIETEARFEFTDVQAALDVNGLETFGVAECSSCDSKLDATPRTPT